jgi:hypothetical protein
VYVLSTRSRRYLVGPRRVQVSNGRALVWLGKDLAFLKGKKVMLEVYLLEEG